MFLSVPCVSFGEAFLHVRKVLVDVVVLMPLVTRLTASSPPCHEKNGLGTLMFDFIAQQNGSVLAFLPV